MPRKHTPCTRSHIFSNKNFKTNKHESTFTTLKHAPSAFWCWTKFILQFRNPTSRQSREIANSAWVNFRGYQTRNSSFMKADPAPAKPSIPPVTERTCPFPEWPGPASMDRPPGAHPPLPIVRPSSPLSRPPSDPPHSPLDLLRWSSPVQSTHVPLPHC